MQRKVWVSLGAAAGFVVLAFGSGDSGDSSVVPPPSVPVVGAVPDAPDEAAPAAPDGQCCCTFLESDAPVTRFEDEAMCRQVQGTCETSMDACVAYQAALEAKAKTCCCSTTEQVIQKGEACEGECYEFYEDGDDPGSCIY